MKPMMQRSAVALTVVLTGLGACSSDGWSPPDMSRAIRSGEHGGGLPQLTVDGRFFRNPAGQVVVLRGVDLIDLKTQDTENNGQTVSSMLDLLSDESQGWHARMVRLMVSPGSWHLDPEGYLQNHLKPAVEHATDRGLYVVIDWHTLEGSSSAADDATRAFWTATAPVFATYTNVLYEVFNQTLGEDVSSWAGAKRTLQPLVDMIRTMARDNILLVRGPSNPDELGRVVDDPLHGDNLAYTVRMYPQLASSLWSDDGPVTKAASARPVVVIEWGFRDGAAPPCSGTQESFGVPFKAWVERTGVSWSAWAAHTTWQPEMFYSSWELRRQAGDMGGFVKDWLAEKKDSDQAR